MTIAAKVYFKAGVKVGAELPGRAWPGMYPLVYVCADGGEVCPRCVNEVPDFKEQCDAQWNVTDVDTYYEGPAIQCAHCNKPIESAYGDPEEEKEP